MDLRHPFVGAANKLLAGVYVGLMTKFGPVAAVFVGLLLSLSPICSFAESLTTADQHVSQLGAGDSVSIQVFGQWEAANIIVADDGTISVPFVGNIQVAGLSPVEAGSRVAKALKDGGFFVDPHVTIVVTQQRSQVVAVLGEVGNVGRYPINPRTTVVDLLVLAGGVKATASDVGFVLRSDENGHVNRFPVKLTGLSDIKDALPTQTLLGGDTLVVPRAEHFFVLGEVGSPGTYSIEPGMTVIQALARAGGINQRGSEHRIELKRLLKNGQYQVLHVKTGDTIQADDIIRVKESIF
jgi:polysaccharide export outer membrane protein